MFLPENQPAPTSHDINSERMYLRRLYLNSQGYTSQGIYFGVGIPLYQYEFEGSPTFFGELRAHTREHAKAQLKAKYPDVTFFN